MQLVPFCTATLEVDPPLQFGRTPSGQRSMSDIVSAEFVGERLRARKAGHSAADWLVLSGAVGLVDVRLALRTHDDALIGVRYQGKLDVSDPRNRASRVAATFDTGDERYGWLAAMLIVGKSRLERRGQHWTVIYDFFEAR